MTLASGNVLGFGEGCNVSQRRLLLLQAFLKAGVLFVER